MSNKLNILFGGAAGTGPNIVTNILGEALIELGYYVFYSRDYESVIRGGHNFNVLSFSDEFIYSNDSQMDVLVCFDEKTKEMHKKVLKKSGVILEGNHPNMHFAGRIFKILGLEFKVLDELLKKLKRGYEENIKEAKEGYNNEKSRISIPKSPNAKSKFINGSQGVSEGAINSGLDFYYAYPMTPATSVLMELAQATLNPKNKHLTIELENEISVVNAGIGSAITGAKAMVGTSGGGFDLMTEGLSLTGIAEVPLVFYLSMRPGPATGVATYTGQGDLKMALNAGHGEFERVVFAAGDPIECEELTNQAFYFSHKYKIPSIILSDKHLGESFYSLNSKAKIIEVKSNTKLERYNSYEKDKFGSATENAEIIKENIIQRMKKHSEIKKDSEKFERYKIFGKQNSKNVIVSWGSPKGAILDAIKNLDCKFVQIIYLSPFPKDVLKLLENKNVILVENNSSASLGSLIKSQVGVIIEDKNKILRFDGRPFLADELNAEIKERLR